MSGYTILETLHEGNDNLLVRAVRDADHRPVVLKVVVPKHSRPEARAQLKHEYETMRELDSPAVVRPLGLDSFQGMPALVLEDSRAQPLERLLGAPMSLDRFLPLAVAITAAVAELHQRSIIHKDLKPQNILVGAAPGEVQLIDFGLASHLPREHVTVPSAGLVEGSLPYISPEQTGRMNRAIDSRTDLYALGVTFYQMLTGELPFTATDPLEWVHCHVARHPRAPSELVPAVPGVLSTIVLRLLAKMAEDRYQTARGLQHDLERCAAAWQVEGRLAPFVLGARDVPDRLEIPQKLYGRAAELDALLSAFARVAEHGTPELVLVSGYSGVGKSALVQEVQRPIAGSRGWFIAGKFERYRRGVPYGAVAQAFTALIEQLLGQSEAQLKDWRERLREALGASGRLILDIIPRAELILGPQPAPPPLPPVEAQNRFHLVFRRFVAVFARREHPLALFLDDLQWLDAESLALVEDLVTHAQTGRLLLLGAYRDNEVTPSHPLMLTLERIRKAGAEVHDIVLQPLALDGLAAFTADALHCDREIAAPLAALVYEKTAGNPFFAVQFLTALVDEDLLRFDRAVSAWRWEVEKIRAKGFTDNVVDLVVNKLRRLAGPTLLAVQQAACLGHTAESNILALLLECSVAEVHARLADAVLAGLLLRLDHTYKFIHDRVHEAAYSLIPEQQRPAMHLRIGRLLQAHSPAAVLPGRIFDIADQLDQGAALITDAAERAALCALNVTAGLQAKAATAHAAALCYLTQAMALLPADAWERRHADTFALHLERAECEYLAGNLATADELLDLALARARSNFDRARVYRLRIRIDQLAGRYDEAVTAMFVALRLFGVELPEAEPELQAATAAELRAVTDNLRDREIADIADAPRVTDPAIGTVISLIVEALPAAVVACTRYFSLLNAKAVNLSLQYGNNAESCVAYTTYAATVDDMATAFALSEMSLRLNENLCDHRLRGALLFMHGAYVNRRKKHLATSRPLLEQAFLACIEAGDVVFAGFVTNVIVWNAIEKGDSLGEVLRLTEKYGAFARESQSHAAHQLIRLVREFVEDLRGPLSTLYRSDDGLAEAGEQSQAELIRMALRQIVAFIYGRPAEALEAWRLGFVRPPEWTSTPAEATYRFYYALTLAALIPEASPAESHDYVVALAREQQNFKRWSEECPENCLNQYALISAEVARIEGRDFEAVRLYEQAIRSAGDNGFVQYEALANELAAQFYRARGLDRFADNYLRAARAGYARWGADGKVRQLDERHPHLRAPPSLGADETVTIVAEQLDLLSIARASQTISREIVVDQLVRTLLAVVLAQSGAQEAYLLFVRAAALTLEAKASFGEHGVAATLLPSSPVETEPRIPVTIVQYARRVKERVLLDDAAGSTTYAADPAIARYKPRSVLCLPVIRQAEVVALLYLENNAVTGAFTPQRLAALEVLAAQAAISLDNASLLAKEKAARAAAESAEGRASFLAEAGALLAKSLDWEETMTRVGRLTVRTLADWCVIDVVADNGEIRRVAGAHADPAKEPALLELQALYTPRIDSVVPAAHVLRTGKPVLLPEMTDALFRSLTVDANHVRLLHVLGTNTAVAVPLVARGQTFGVLTLASAAPGRRYDAADLALAEELARRAALSLDNARLYREAQAAIHLREEFVMVASHELNTPIAAMELAIQKLLRAKVKATLSEDVQRMLGVIERQGWELTTLVGEMLDVAQIHAGQLHLELADVDLAAVVRAVAERLHERFTRARCTLVMPAMAPVVGRWDRGRLEQAFTNLLDNALKFGAGKPIEVEVTLAGSQGRLVVKDHGIGLAPDQMPRIFRRFEHAAPARHYGGLGLGLFIVHEIVTALGGQIHVESSVGAGSTFTVELPRCGPRPASQMAA